MSVPFVEVTNLNQSQGAVTEVERYLLFVGQGETNTGKLLTVDTQTDFDIALGPDDTPLKQNLIAARDNAGQNWAAAVAIIDKTTPWQDAVRAAQSLVSVEGCLILDQAWDKAAIEAAYSLSKEILANYGRWLFMLLATPGIRTEDDAEDETLLAQSWDDYTAEQVLLQADIAAPAVGLVPQLWPNLAGVYAGRLCNHSVSVADSPARVKTGALVGLGDLPVDAEGVALPLATLAALSTARFSVPYWYPDYDGIYWSDGMQLDAEGGDYQVIENLRVACKVSRRVRTLAIKRIADRSLNSTPRSEAAAIQYFGKPLREMSRVTTINNQPFPGDISPPKEGDITIQWLSKTQVVIWIVVRTVDCPKGITINILLDTSLTNDEA
ncbi:DUF2586 domain-containing protein [Aeromonas enteropelogenes]|uniref:DUF2586 domain-containing protein n=1 Tax=Aeromonas enteropelogenes TaxID=29489 RepID=UPI003BA14816